MVSRVQCLPRTDEFFLRGFQPIELIAAFRVNREGADQFDQRRSMGVEKFLIPIATMRG